MITYIPHLNTRSGIVLFYEAGLIIEVYSNPIIYSSELYKRIITYVVSIVTIDRIFDCSNSSFRIHSKKLTSYDGVNYPTTAGVRFRTIAMIQN